MAQHALRRQVLAQFNRQFKSSSSRSYASRRYASAASATAASSLADNLKGNIQREASLPNPDPPEDSSTTAFLQQNASYMVPTYVRPPPVMTKGEGCYIWDMENRRYLDFTAGIAVNALGHADPEMCNLIMHQSRTLIHASNLYHNPWTPALSQLMVDETQRQVLGSPLTQAFISNSGSEANEAALKFARKVAYAKDPSSKKRKILSFHNSFHGRTYGSLSATPNEKYQAPFGPMLPGFEYGHFNDVESLSSLITPETCGVIVEPIQGEGGVNVPTPEFLHALRDHCNRNSALLIFDEIQCGLSRTGKLWAHSHYLNTDDTTTHPDILTTAKALGNGIPIGATLISGTSVGPYIKTGDHGTTFGGNPLACRIAHYVFSRLATDTTILPSIPAKSALFTSFFHHTLQRRFPGLFSELRGKGLILGMQLALGHHEKAAQIVTAARERGLLVITAGQGALRIVPPLVISEEEIRLGLEILEEAVAAVWMQGMGKGEGEGEGVKEGVEATKGQQEMAGR